jgi:hypothetical protein
MWTRHRWFPFVSLPLFLGSCLAVRWLVKDDTIYAPGYSEARFRSIRVGMPRDEVIRALGQPVSVQPAPGYVYWTYALEGYRHPRPPANGPTYPPPETTFQADPAGKIVSVTGGYLDVKEGDFLGRQLEEVRKRFGDPLEVQSAADRDLYWYSKMDGVKGHFVRIIHISTKGTVCDISAGCIGYYVGAEDEQYLSWIEWLELHL